MRIFAIGDLHLPGGQEKPMDIFGTAWIDHPEQIRHAWLERIAEDDLVLIPGDISWAMTLEEAREDLRYLGGLPGTILLIRGNHDYWWQAIGRVRSALPENVKALQNDHFPLPDGTAICGARGWDLPDLSSDPHDVKVYRRELGRLQLSLESAQAAGLRPRIVMTHFPPTMQDGRKTEVTELLEAFGVERCVYGHLHGQGARHAIRGTVRGVTYYLVACDAVQFTPVLIEEI